MLTNIKNLTEIILIILTLWVFIFGFFQFDMGMDQKGKMVNCPFSNHSMSICKMNPLEHLQEWQSMFTTLPARDIVPLLTALLSILALLGLKFFEKFSLSEQSKTGSYLNIFYFKKLFIPHPLEIAFSRGVLNPKIF